MNPTVFSLNYPPRNRKPTRLSVIELEVTGQGGSFQLDLNRAMMLACGKELPFGDPLQDVPSVITGTTPSYILRTCEIELALAPRELLALWRRELTPNEFFRLRDTFGIFFEIHDDFYDEPTGLALDRMGDRGDGHG